jgi:hypothetical protein
MSDDLEQRTGPEAESEQENTQALQDAAEVKTAGGRKFHKRINTLTRRLYEAQDQIDALRSENAQLKNAVNLPEGVAGGIEQRAQAIAGERHAQQIIADFQDRLKRHIDSQGNPEAIRAAMQQTSVPSHLNGVLLTHPLGHEIVVHIASNPHIANELSAMSPEDSIMKLGELAAALSTGEKPAKADSVSARVESKAPAPVATGSGRTITITPLGGEGESYRDYRRQRDSGRRP